MHGDPYTAPIFSASALITIDVQRDTLDGRPLEIPGTSQALPAMERLLEGFRRARRPIVHVVRLYRVDGSNVDPCRRRLVEEGTALLAPGSEGAELAPGLAPDPDIRLDTELLLDGGIQEFGPGEAAIYKPRWGAFYGTDLEAHLREQDITTLVFCGCNFPNCPRTSIYEASERDFRVVVAVDAVSDIYERGERELSGIGVAMIGSDEVVDSLRREPEAAGVGTASNPGS